MAIEKKTIGRQDSNRSSRISSEIIIQIKKKKKERLA